MTPIIIVLVVLNFLLVGCMSDFRKIMPDPKVVNFCFGSKMRRILMLIPPIGIIVGLMSFVRFAFCAVLISVANYINDK